jgi:hypothetical protein
MGTMNLILVIMFLCLLSFTITMIWLFTMFGSVPDTLITCVFAALAGECGIMGWIKTTKERQRDRRWQKQDERQAREAMEQAVQQQDDLPDNP